MVRSPRLIRLALCAIGLYLTGCNSGSTSLNSPTIPNTPIIASGSSQTSYVEPLRADVSFQPILTVGDRSQDGYRLAGVPDGLGAFDNGDGTFTLLVDHEIPQGQGVTRAHGASGAFVSKWIIRKSDMAPLHGEDLIRFVATWNTGQTFWNSPSAGIAFNRLCSGTLAPISAFFDTASHTGFDGRIWTSGEEGGGSRAFAHLLNGLSYELPRMGKMSFENVVPHPALGASTAVVAIDDSSDGQIYIYVGTKQNSGNAVEMAGLNNGRLFGIAVNGFSSEGTPGIPRGTAFTGKDLGDVSTMSASQLDSASKAAGVTGFRSPEDGAWDPAHPNDFYFATTDHTSLGASRLWRLRFNNPADPASGGTIDMLLAGTEGQVHMDNIAVSAGGDVIIQEDPDNDPALARIWRYRISSASFDRLGQVDPNRFRPPTPAPFNQDEETSGVIDVSDILGAGYFILTVQAHYSNGGELVEGGQLVLMHAP